MLSYGDYERAASLDGNDPLATLLFQIASPAHIPWGDARWHELLHGYEVWVHLTTNDDDPTSLVSRACQSMAKHAGVSSNLAALCLHVTRMLRVLVKDVRQQKQEDSSNDGDGASDFSRRVSRVGKARATAGALQLLRILCHQLIASASLSENDGKKSSGLEEAFLYHTRGDLPCDQPAALPLLHSLLDLISVAGGESNDAIQTPEVYDAVVLSFHLLFVLMGSQLYRPFRSSFEEEKANNRYFCLQELFQEPSDDNGNNKSTVNLRRMFASHNGLSAGSLSSSTSSPHEWTPQSIMEACMEWQIRRPPAPERSLAYAYYHLAKSAVSAGQTVGLDGMYETHAVVQAAAPIPKHADRGGDEHKSNEQHSKSPHHHQINSKNVILDATRGVLVLSSSIILLPFRLMNLVLGALTSKGREKAIPSGRRYQASSGAQSRTKDVLWLSESCLADLGGCLVLLLANNFRNGYNPFRQQLKGLQDNRWQDGIEEPALPDLPNLDATLDVDESQSFDQVGESPVVLENCIKVSMHANFESLFVVFGRTLHNEVG